jgi:hypothetical protein
MKIGQSSSSFYLSNPTLSAAAALHLNLTTEVYNGISVTQRRAQMVAAAAGCVRLPSRKLADQTVIAKEAVGHAECLLLNGGEAQAATYSAPSNAEESICVSALTTGHTTREGVSTSALLTSVGAFRSEQVHGAAMAVACQNRWQRSRGLTAVILYERSSSCSIPA